MAAIKAQIGWFQ